MNGSASQFVSGSIGGSVLSNIELHILRSDNPIDIQVEDEISVLGERGILVNKNEIAAWRGKYLKLESFFIVRLKVLF